MGKIHRILCCLLAALTLLTIIPRAHAAQAPVEMWNMQDVTSENTTAYSDFRDLFGYIYDSAVCFDVALGSGAVYELGGRYSQFTGTLTTSPETNGDAFFDFAIALDGKIEYSISDFHRESKPEEIVLDLTGVQTMQILTSTKCNSYTFLFVADGFFTPAQTPIQPNAQKTYTLLDTVLVASNRYKTAALARDTFGVHHINNYFFGDYSDSYAVYNLDKKYDTFTATIFADSEFGNNLYRSFTVYCDDKRVKHYEKIDRQTNPFEIEIDVRNVTVLKIESVHTRISPWSSYDGYLVVGDVALTPHVHVAGELREDVAPTCTQSGKKSYTCTVCGEACDIEVFPALPHTPGDWEIISEPTCSQPGQRAKCCQVCGTAVETEALERLPHTPSGDWVVKMDASCYAEGTEGLVCEICGEFAEERAIPRAEHQMGDWEYYNGSIWSAPIYSVRTCYICDAREEQYDYAFAWLKPLVLTTLLLLVLAAAVCDAMATRLLPGGSRDKRDASVVLRKALALKNKDVTAAVRALRSAMSDQDPQNEP